MPGPTAPSQASPFGLGASGRSAGRHGGSPERASGAEWAAGKLGDDDIISGTFPRPSTLPVQVPTDDDLMAAFRAGDTQAFDQLFGRYRQPIWAFFARRADASSAEELAQDTFVALLESAKRYDPRGTFRSYLFGIAYNVLGSGRRATRREPVDAASCEEPGADLADPTSIIWVRQALAALDDVDREVLMLREFDQLRYDEIAAVIGVPVNTVRSRLFRARSAMRERLLGAHMTPRTGA